MIPVKLVFVDDDPDDRELITDGLLANGADSFLVLESGRILMAYLNAANKADFPEAIVLDFNMPQMNGLQVLQYLKSTQIYSQIPVYILTTTSREEIKQLCIMNGAAGYYTKPNSIQEIHTILNELYTSV